VAAIASDMRHVLRALARRPAFTISAIATLSLGLAGVIAIIAIADMVVLRPLPYPKPHRLYSLSATIPGPDGAPAPYLLSAVEFLRVKAEAASLEQVEAMTPSEMAMTTESGPVTARIGSASAGYLSLFGLDPIIGRPFTESEEREQASVAVLDGGFWSRHFGGDRSVIGRTIVLDGRPFAVIGITEAGHQPQLQTVDAWVPLNAIVEPARPGPRMLIAAARLREGARPERAADEVARVQAGIAKEFPNTHARAVLVFVELHEALYGSYRSILLLLFAGVAILLLIACGNVANLTLARAAERSADIALRLSLGASRRRIVVYQLTESALLTGAAVIIGGLLSWWAVTTILAIDPHALPSDANGRISLRAAAAIATLFALTSAIAGLLPAFRAATTSARLALAPSATGQLGRAGDRRVREWLLGAQIMFAVLLLGSAGMIASGFRDLNRTDPGFDYRHVLTLQLAPPARYPQPQARGQLISRMLERIEQIPGVVSAGSTQTNWRLRATVAATVVVEGYAPAPGENVLANVRHLTPGYFRTLRPRIEAGRPFDERDHFGAPGVAIVSRSFADKFWPGRSAIGRRIRRISANAPWLTIVGVTADVMDNGLGSNTGPTMFFPYYQQNTPSVRVTLVVRTSVDPLSVAREVQKAVWSVDAQQPIGAVESLESALDRSTAQPRFRAIVLAVFGVTGAALACVGVYGVAAYASARRRREVGLRIALGASPKGVRGLLVRQSMTSVVLGATLGVLGIAMLATLFPSRLPPGAAPWTWAMASAAALAACAFIATWIPACRATRVSPLIALRQD
jgi:putative ABC transport system permease protein